MLNRHQLNTSKRGVKEGR